MTLDSELVSVPDPYIKVLPPVQDNSRPAIVQIRAPSQQYIIRKKCKGFKVYKRTVCRDQAILKFFQGLVLIRRLL